MLHSLPHFCAGVVMAALGQFYVSSISALGEFYVRSMSVLCQFYGSARSVLCQFYVSSMSVLCQFYGSVRSVLCQFYVRGYMPHESPPSVFVAISTKLHVDAEHTAARDE